MSKLRLSDPMGKTSRQNPPRDEAKGGKVRQCGCVLVLLLLALWQPQGP